MRTPRERRLLAYFVTALLTIATITFGAPAATADDHSANSWKKTCFGNQGTFADSSIVLKIDWTYDVPECFGVAPSGTIWHTWQGASKWYEMRGNGLATNIDVGGTVEYTNGDRTIAVYVSWGGHKYYCQDYIYSSRSWTGSWYKC